MNNTIYLKNISQQKIKDGVKIFFTFKIRNKQYKLWYKITSDDCKISKVPERCDGFVVTFLLFAMWHKLDIESKYPISEKLYYNLTYHIIPKISRSDLSQKSNRIRIKAPITQQQVKSHKWVGTGISCGVDSLSTIYEYTEMCKLKDYKITHLIHMKTGAHDGQIGRANKEVENKLFKEQLKNAKRFCMKNNFPLIVADSNLNIILSDAFGFTNYDRTHTFRSCGTMLLLQNYFSKYYYASSGLPDTFDINTDFSCALYERWFLPLLSSSSLECYSANQGMMRIEKTALLSEYQPSYDNLLVCLYSGKNCGKCDKCIRTLITLDILGKLNLYKHAFNIEEYKQNKQEYFQRLYDRKEYDRAFLDIYTYIQRNKINIPELEFIKTTEHQVLVAHSKQNRIKNLIYKIIRRLKLMI